MKPSTHAAHRVARIGRAMRSELPEPRGIPRLGIKPKARCFRLLIFHWMFDATRALALSSYSNSKVWDRGWHYKKPKRAHKNSRRLMAEHTRGFLAAERENNDAAMEEAFTNDWDRMAEGL